MTIANLGIAVTSNADKAAVDLDKLTASSNRAETSARKLEGASRGAARATDQMGSEASGAATATAQLEQTVNMVAAAQGRAVVATNASTAALRANAAAAQMVQMNQRMLMFQMVDIGQALATAPTMGIYALQNLGFQFAQIGQQYWGQGGMGAALRDMSKMLGGAVVRMGPLIAVTAVAAAGLAGLTYEFNKTAETAVNMGDVALAGFQLLGEGIAAAVMPAVNQVVTWLQNLWDWIAPGLKAAGNGIVGTFVFAYEAALASWSSLPAAMGDVVITTANVIVAGVEEAINRAAELIDAFIDKANENLGQFGLAIPNVGRVSFGGFANPFAGAGRDYQDLISSARDNAFGQDYLGDLGGAWSQRAQQIALARQEMEGLAGATGAANDNAKKLAEEGLSKAAEAAQKLTDNLGQSIGGALRGLIEGTKSLGEVLKDVLFSVAQFAAQQAASIFSGMGGGFGFLGSIISGFFGGGFADGGYTGNGATSQVAGVVHGGEYVFSARAVDQIGLGYLDQLHTAGRGYRDGGYVSPLPANRNIQAPANQNGGHIEVRVVTEVVNGDLRPTMVEVAGEISGQQVRRAVPVAMATTRAQAAKDAPAAVTQYQRQRAGSDYRTM